jgi:hypothetical protein
MAVALAGKWLSKRANSTMAGEIYPPPHEIYPPFEIYPPRFPRRA